jgi:hypothetical protein
LNIFYEKVSTTKEYDILHKKTFLNKRAVKLVVNEVKQTINWNGGSHYQKTESGTYFMRGLNKLSWKYLFS